MFDIVCSLGWTSRDRCCDLPSMVSKPPPQRFSPSLSRGIIWIQLDVDTRRLSWHFSNVETTVCILATIMKTFLNVQKLLKNLSVFVRLSCVCLNICWAPLTGHLIERPVSPPARYGLTQTCWRPLRAAAFTHPETDTAVILFFWKIKQAGQNQRKQTGSIGCEGVRPPLWGGHWGSKQEN